MNKKQKKRLWVIVILVVLLSVSAGLVLYALKQNINLFYTPTELLAATPGAKDHLRVGGYVKKGSVNYSASGDEVSFIITDRVKEILVNYHGVLPSLFREGQGVVVTGQLEDKKVIAHEVLAKHDEKYMPKPIRNLKKGEGYGT